MSGTDFSLLEPHKENIERLREGRSARALASVFQQESEKNKTQMKQYYSEERARYQQEIADCEMLDDPIQPYLDYIQWTRNTFPQGSSNESGLLQVLEECTSHFKNTAFYKQDPRYLKVWLQYISYSECQRDVFTYLYRNSIGTKLAIFYEEFARCLIRDRRFSQAREVFTIGIENQARPLPRLEKRFLEFQEMNYVEDVGPRSALNLISGSAGGLEGDQEQDEPSSRKILDVYRDEDDAPKHTLGEGAWEHLGSKHTRTKENTLRAPTWQGETIQQTHLPEVGDKVSVFSDSPRGPVYKVIEVTGKKPEKIDCNFDLLYGDEEFSIEEVLAKARGVYFKREVKRTATRDASQTKKRPRLAEIKPAELEAPSVHRLETPVEYRLSRSEDIILESRLKRPLSSVSVIERPPSSSIRDLPLSSKPIDPVSAFSPQTPTKRTPPQKISPYRESQVTSTVPLKDDTTTTKPRSPTMTMFSKNAMSEVYSMFNQEYTQLPAPERESTSHKFAMYENFTQEITSARDTDDLTEVEPKLEEESRDGEEDGNVATQETIVYNDDIADGACMTPIRERTERLSSPFFTQPPVNIISNPLDDAWRHSLLKSSDFQYYSGYYKYRQDLRMSEYLKKVFKVGKLVNKQPVIDFKKTDDLYCIKAELGEGGYATVYLAESSKDGELKALKVEKPSNIWEFYILKTVFQRLQGSPVLHSIIQVDSLHMFNDESYLVLKYANQGTILDAVNYYKSQQTTMSQELVLFITCELLKIVTQLHSAHIIHGDLKADNCMLRLNGPRVSTEYDPLGQRGNWDRKGVYLIDFGRSLDMELVPEGTKFKCTWKTDEQDCPEMRLGESWSFECDYYGLAGIVHTMLFGSYITTTQVNGRWQLTRPLKRYWKQELWLPLFDLLLNSKLYGDPITQELLTQVEYLEKYLSDASFASDLHTLQQEMTIKYSLV